MKTLTYLASLLFGGTCFFCVPALAEEIEPGTSFTDRIVEAGVDSGTGWTVVSGAPSYKISLAEVWNATFQMEQTITVPPGTYDLTVDALYRAGVHDAGEKYKNGTEVIKAFLYSVTSAKSKEIPLQSIYSVSNFTTTGALKNGYVDNVQAARDAFDQGLFANNVLSRIVVGEDGQLTIGLKMIEVIERQWAIWDNFQLIYQGPAGLGVYKDEIDEIMQILDNHVTLQNVPSGILTQIEEATAFKDLYYSEGTEEELKAVIDSLNRVVPIAKEAVPTMALLLDWIDRADLLPTTYPGWDAFETVYNASIDIVQPDATIDGHLVFNKDLVKAVADLKTACRNYRMTETVADKEVGLDFTFTMTAPSFTKELGDPSLAADRSSEGWVTANNPTTGGDYKLHTVNKKNCWNNWSNNFVSMNVYQDISGLPAGLYSFSFLQTNNGTAMSDQHAYAMAMGVTAVSPSAVYTFNLDPDPDKGTFTENSKWEGPLETEKVLVGTDGKLRVGFASTSAGGTSGWFCITGGILRYYGPDDTGYGPAMQTLIESSELLLEKEMLVTDRTALNNAIAIAKVADISTVEKAEAALNALSEVVASVQTHITALGTFKAGVYAKVSAISANVDDIYASELAALMTVAIGTQDAILASDTTTGAAFVALNADLNLYLSYSTAYINYESYASALTELMDLKEAVLTAQTASVTADKNAITPAIALFKSAVAFSNIYTKSVSYYLNEEYPENLRAVLSGECEAQYEVASTDHSKFLAAEQALCKALGDMVFTGLGYEAGEDTEVTEAAIINPTIESTGGSDPIEGWTVDKTDGNTFSTISQHWTGDATNRYLDSYANAGVLKYNATQEILGIPNGTYKLVAATRSSGVGAYLYAIGSEIKFTEIPVHSGSGGGIWADAPEGDTLKRVNNGLGRGWTWLAVSEINVHNNRLLIGCTTRKEITGGKAWAGTWFSADDFKLFWTSVNYDGTEDMQADDSSEGLKAYSRNGYIIVEGVESYSVTTIGGVPVSAQTQLPTGFYIVMAGDKVAKVFVE